MEKEDIFVVIGILVFVAILTNISTEKVLIQKINSKVENQKQQKPEGFRQPIIQYKGGEDLEVREIVISHRGVGTPQYFDSTYIFSDGRRIIEWDEGNDMKNLGIKYIEHHIVPTFANNESQTEKKLKVEKALQELHTYVYKNWRQKEDADSIYEEYAKKIRDMAENPPGK